MSKNFSIKKKLILGFLLTVALSVSITGYVSYRTAERYIRNEAEEDIKFFASKLQKELSPYFQSADQAQTILRENVLFQLSSTRDFKGDRETMRAYILDREGNFLADSSGPRTHVNPHPLVKDFFSSCQSNDRAGARIYTSDDAREVLGTVTCLEQNVLLVTEMETREAFWTFNELRRNLFLLTFAILIFVGLLGYMMANYMSRPLLALIDAAKKVSEGNFSFQAEVQSQDEIGQLAGTFNFMLSSLKELYKSLEEKVENRTRELRKAYAKEQAIFFSIGDGLVVVNKNRKIVMVNKAFETLTGWKQNEVEGKLLQEVLKRENEKGEALPEKDSELEAILGRKKAKKPSAKNKPFYCVRKDASKFPALSVLTPIEHSQKIIGAVEVIRDITEEKAVDEAKSEFVSLASHQLRSPLSTINWYVEALKDERLGPLNAEQKEYLQNTGKAVERMMQLVKSLLDISRIEAGTFFMEFEPVNLGETCDTIVRNLRPQIQERNITISTHYDPALPMVESDPKLVQLVFQNLLTNALKYTPPEGKIKVTVQKEKNAALIKVEDNGCGIPEAEKARIFQKLYRAKNANKLSTEGTGLGLYIIKVMAERSGGKVWFTSKENKGSAFYVSLPLKRPRKGR